MPIDTDGIFSKRTTEEILNELVARLRDEFGSDVDVSATGTIRKLLEAAVALPLAETQNELDILYQQLFFSTASGQNLDNLLEPFGFTRKIAARAEGTVEINFRDRETGAPGVLFPSGSIDFIDTAGRVYALIEDIDIPEAVVNNTSTGTASEQVDAITTRIAQKFSVVGQEFVQAFAAQVAHVTGTPTFTVRIETDLNGEPSGTLADAKLELAGWQPPDGVDTSEVFVQGAYLDEGDYWLVFQQTSGEATFDGGNTGTADQVMTFSGATWSLSSNVENLNTEVVRGGIATVQANLLGRSSNALAETIVDVSFNTAPASTDWAAKVETFTNLNDIEGGQDRETDLVYRARVRSSLASSTSASPDGIAVSIEELDGVRGVRVIENTTAVTTQLDTEFDNSAATGTASSLTISGADDRLGQKFQVTDRRFIQHFSGKLDSDTDLVCKVRIETDNAGEPSGVLAGTGMEVSGFDFNGTSQTGGTLGQGQYLSPGTDYWLVFEWESGSGVFDGDNSGAAGDVKVEDAGGGYANDGNINAANTQVIGGLPPHSFRAYISGGRINEIAQAIWDNRPAGIVADGPDSGTATDIGGSNHIQYFERPTEVGVVLSITVEADSSFTGDEDTIRDVIIAYIGGFNTSTIFEEGLTVAQRLVYREVIARVLDDDLIPGLLDVTDLKVGRKADFPTPGSLTATENVNLVAQAFEEFTVEDATLDVEVTIV